MEEKRARCEALVKKVSSEMTIYDRFKYIITRLCSRYDEDTVNYLKTNYGVDPAWDINEGAEGKYRTTSQVRNMIRSWKQNTELVHKPMTEEQLDKLDRQCREAQEILRPGPTKVGRKKQTKEQVEHRRGNEDYWGDVNHVVNFRPGNAGLPQLVGCLKDPKGEGRIVSSFLVDSGATMSVMPRSTLEKLGVTLDRLDNRVRIKIATALAETQALGCITLPLYIKDIQGRFNKILVTWIVIDSPSLKRNILGVDILSFLNYRLEYKDDRHLLTLHCLTGKDNLVRRSYDLTDCVQSANFSNLTKIPSGISRAKFVSGNPPAFLSGQKMSLSCNQTDVKIAAFETDEPEKYFRLELDEKGEPKNIYGEIELEVNNVTHQHRPGVVDVKLSPPEGTALECLAKLFQDNDLAETEEELQRAMRTDDETQQEALIYHMERIEEELYSFEDVADDPAMADGVETAALDEALEVMNPSPPVIEPQKDPIIPDISHMKEPWKSRYKELFTSFADAISQHTHDLGCVTALPAAQVEPRPGVGPPVREGSRRYADIEKKIIREHVENMEKSGIIEEVDSHTIDHNLVHWLHLVPKHSKQMKLDRSTGDRKKQLDPDNTRITHDLRKVNNQLIIPPPLALPTIQDLAPLTVRAGQMSGIDLKSGFHQCPLSEEAKDWFIFTDGSNRYYRFCRVPMGWSGACEHFQRTVRGVFNYEDFIKFQREIKSKEFDELKYSQCISIYLDDLHLHSRTEEQHFLLVKFILTQARKFNLKLNAKKCEIITEQAECLGFSMSPSRKVMSLSEPRAKLIQSWEMPMTPRSVLARLSSLNYFNCVLPALRYLCICLQHFAVQSDKSDFMISEVHVKEFLAIQTLITCNVQFMLPDLSKPIILSSDASFGAYGGMCFQYVERPTVFTPEGPTLCETDSPDHVLSTIGCYSRSFGKTFLTKAIVYKELAAVIKTLQIFRPWVLQAPRCIFFTDCIAITYLR